MVRALLEAGADPELMPAGGDAPLSSAVNIGEPRVLDLLLDAGAAPDRTGGYSISSPLHEAVGVGRIDELRRLLEFSPDPDVGRDADNDPLAGDDVGVGSPLEFAADLDRRVPFAVLLLEAEATATITALYRAVSRGSAEMVTLLLDAGAPVSVSDRETRTMADVARAAGYPDIARLLEDRT